MKLNSHTKKCFHDPTMAYVYRGEGISGHNCMFGDMAALVRKKSSRIDRVNYIYNEKTRYIYAKRNADGIRR